MDRCHLLVAENRQPLLPNNPGSEIFYQELSEEETCEAYHGMAALLEKGQRKPSGELCCNKPWNFAPTALLLRGL
jgi:hypothetical protein